MKIILPAALGLLLATSCKSKKAPTLTETLAPRFASNVQSGSYYRTTGLSTAFYDEQPDSLVIKVPTRILGPRHVVQLLDANAGAGWARVRNEKGDLGFVKFSSLKIVPLEDQPDAPKARREFWND